MDDEISNMIGKISEKGRGCEGTPVGASPWQMQMLPSVNSVRLPGSEVDALVPVLRKQPDMRQQTTRNCTLVAIDRWSIRAVGFVTEEEMKPARSRTVFCGQCRGTGGRTFHRSRQHSRTRLSRMFGRGDCRESHVFSGNSYCLVNSVGGIPHSSVSWSSSTWVSDTA